MGTTILIIFGIVILLFIGMIVVLFLGLGGTATAIAKVRQNQKEAWEYWEKMKHKSWQELTPEEREEMISNYMIIADDCGIVVSPEEIREDMKTQLPIHVPHVGLTHRSNSKPL